MQKTILLYTDAPDCFRCEAVSSYLKNIDYFEIVHQQGLETSFETKEAGIELLIILLMDKIQKHRDAIEVLRNTHSDIPLLIIYSEMLNMNDVKSIYKGKPLALFNTRSKLEDLQYCKDNLSLQPLTLCRNTQTVLLESVLVEEEIRPGQTAFSSKEKMIIENAVNGLSIQESAEQLQLSPNTVAAYRSKILKKANARNMLQLVSRYL